MRMTCDNAAAIVKVDCFWLYVFYNIGIFTCASGYESGPRTRECLGGNKDAQIKDNNRQNI